jgi:ubiquitin carboxyl-terminal hydrolase 7
MKPKQSLKAAELQDGDIVCFQLASGGGETDMSVAQFSRYGLTNLACSSSTKARSPSSTSSDSASMMSDKTVVEKGNPDRIENAPQYYDFLLHKREVWFTGHPTRTTNPDQFPPFSITLSSKHTYDQVASKVGDRLGVDPTHLRFWTVNATNGNPKASVKRGQSQNLQTILSPPYSTYSNNNQRNNELFFEVLDISLSELDTKKSLKLAFLSEGISKVVSIYPPMLVLKLIISRIPMIFLFQKMVPSMTL